MCMNYSKRHNKFLFPSLAGAIYGNSCNAENEISNVVNYSCSSGSLAAEVNAGTDSAWMEEKMRFRYRGPYEHFRCGAV